MKILGYTIIKTAKLLHIYEKLAIFVTEKLRNKDRFNMKFNVTIQNVLPIQSGTSKSGKAYSRQSYVGVYDSSNPQYPKSIVFDVLGDNINKFNLQQGGQYEVEVDFTVREWKGKYFLSANCWKATPIQQEPPNQQQQQPYGQAPTYSVNPQSATPTLDAMGVKGYQQGQYAQQTQTAQNGDDDGLPF